MLIIWSNWSNSWTFSNTGGYVPLQSSSCSSCSPILSPLFAKYINSYYQIMINLKHFLSKESATSFHPLLNDKIPKTQWCSHPVSAVHGCWDLMKGFYWLWLEFRGYLFLWLSLRIYFFSSQLLLSNIEEVLVYFCLVLESEHAAGSDSHPDQTGMCSSWGRQSDQTNVRNTFGTSIIIHHNCLMRSMKLEESLMLHKITNKPTG